MNPLSTWTYYRRHKGYATLLLSLSIIVTVGLFSLVALSWGVLVEPARLSIMAYSKFSMVTLRSGESGPDPELKDLLGANPDVSRVMPTTIIRIQLPSLVAGQTFQFDLLGLTEEDAPYVLERFGARLQDGHLPEPGTPDLLLSADVARMLGLTVGDSYDVISSEFYRGMDTPLEPTSFDVVGIVESDVELGIVSLEFLNQHGQYRQFPARFLVLAREGREAVVDGFLRDEIQTNETAVMTFDLLSKRIINEALPGLLMLLPILLLVAIGFSLVTVVVNQIANAQRLPEFGILHATGLSTRWLIRRLTRESATLALVGWAMGVGLSWLLLYLLKVTLFASRGHDLNYILWMPIVFTLPIPATIAGVTFLDVRRVLARLDPVAIVERREQVLEDPRKEDRTASVRSPKPLAPTTFYRRHRQRSLLLIGGMSLMIMAVALFIFTIAVDADAQEPFQGYLSRVSIIQSVGIAQDLDPHVVAQVKAHPAVERVIPVAPRISALQVHIPPFSSAEASPFGVYSADMVYLVELYGLELREGRLPRAGTNEMVIPEALSDNRELEVGDVVGNPNRPAYPGASSLDTEFVISGVFAQPTAPADGSGWGFTSLEFLETTSLPVPEVPALIVVPKVGQKGALDQWLEDELADSDVSVLTYDQQLSRIRQKARQDMLGIALLEGVVVLVAVIGLAVLNYIFVSQRLSEFGVLHALGYSRRQLVGRVLGETAFTMVVAWCLAAITVLLGMLVLRYAVYAPRGLSFDLLSLAPWLYTLPIPLAVLAVAGGTTAWTLSKLDAVSIIERRE